MQIGMVGRGRMAASLVRRLIRGGRACVVSDVQSDAMAPIVHDGAVGTSSLDDRSFKLTRPRVAWMIVPAVVDQSMNELSRHDEGVPAHVLSAPLCGRFSSRGNADFTDQLLSAMRYEFGGHLERTGTTAGSRPPRNAQ